MDSAEALLLGLHGQLLRLLSVHAGCHCQGIHQASRRCRGLTPAQCKRIRNDEVAFNVMRHITAPFVDGFVAEVSLQLAGGTQRQDHGELCSPIAGAPSTSGQGPTFSPMETLPKPRCAN